jgi:hypothetical protein
VGIDISEHPAASIFRKDVSSTLKMEATSEKTGSLILF